MEILKFLGIGSAFNLENDNNCAYFIDNETFVLFDCGDRIARKIINYKLLENIKHVLIVITHLHADHISSLETLLDYLYLVRKDIDCKVMYPYKDGLSKILDLEATFDYSIDDSKELTFNNINVKAIPANHIDNSYSYLVKTSNFSFYYSGDTNKLNLDVLKMLKNNEIDLMYHEVSYPNISVHTSIDDLIKYIPQDLRKRVYLMHFSDKKLIELAKNNGFNVPNEL